MVPHPRWDALHGCLLRSRVGYHGWVQTDEFRALVKGVVEQGRTLNRAEAAALLAMLLAGPPGELAPSREPAAASAESTLPVAFELGLAALLAAMALRGETAEELCGFAEAMRAAALPIPLSPQERALLVDTCGTGGDGLDTFNISTAAALIAAGAGAWIAKHGNRAITSRCGSADVLEALGVPIALTPEQGAECLRVTRFLFMPAPALHPAMARVGPVRRALPFRTIFNLAGPLANPAGAMAQVVGVYAEARIPVVAEALRLLGTRHAWVVHGRVPATVAGSETMRGLDELTVTGASIYATVRQDRMEQGIVSLATLAALGLPVAPLSALKGGVTAEQNASLIEAVLKGTDRGARRMIALLNAAAALVVAELVPDLAAGLARAAEAVDSGSAARVLSDLRAFGKHAQPARTAHGC